MHALVAALALFGLGSPPSAEVIGPYFVVDAQINRKAVRLIVDTGAGMNVVTPEAADRLGLKGGVPVTARGVGSQGVPARIVSLESFMLQGSPNANPQAVVIPLPPMLEVDGLVGHGFLSQYVATFDYAGGKIAFSRPAEFVPPQDAVAVPLRVRSNIPEVQMAVDGFEGWVKVDSGASDNLTLFKSFVDSRRLREKLKGVRPEFGGRGVGGLAMSDRAVIDGLTLAGFSLRETTISLSKQTSGAFTDAEAIGNLGAGILRRFEFSLDYSAGKAYFRKGKLFDEPELRDRLGAPMDFDAQGHRVVWVYPKSPAEAAGIKIGDRLLEVDGKPTSDLKAMAVWERFRAPAGTKVSLRLRSSSGAEKQVQVTLADF